VRTTPATLVFVLCTACAPGKLYWPGGEEPLRSILFYVEPISGGGGATDYLASHATLALSTSVIECDPMSTDSDWQIAEADFLTALGREGARHILIDLYKAQSTDWIGRFHGTSGPDFATLVTDSDLQRIAGGTYLAIDEAAVPEEDGLIRYYQPTSVSLATMGDSGWLDINTWEDGDNGGFSGSFNLGNAHIAGTIRDATRCSSTSIAFEILRGCADADLTLAAQDDADASIDILALCAGDALDDS